TEKATSLREGRMRSQAAVECDQVEQIAMLARCSVQPFSDCAPACLGSLQPDKQASAGRVPHVADQPVAALASAVREIMATHQLGLKGETTCQISGLG